MERKFFVCDPRSKDFCSTTIKRINFGFGLGLFEIFCQYPFPYSLNILSLLNNRVSFCILVSLSATVY